MTRRHVIKNHAALSSTALRKDALAVLEAGLRAIDTGAAVRRACRLRGDVFSIGRRSWNLAKFENVYVIGIGKAAYDSAVAIERVLGRRISGGVILDVKSGPLRRMRSYAGTHPFPSEINMRATDEIIDLLVRAERKDLVIAVVSGGGSALLCRPYKLKCDVLALVTRVLMAKGADINEINTVRKHLSEVQGGQLAELAYPATVIGLLFSDVPGDNPGIIASGPTVLDQTTVHDASEILSRYGIVKACRMPDCDLRETPKDPALFKKIANVLLMTNAVALDAMKAEGLKRGYRVNILTRTLSGEARDAGASLARKPRPGEMILAGGETTVTMRGKGRGGRNQELALGAFASVPDDGLVLSCASDGIDNTPAAGAIVDEITKRRAEAKKLDSESALANNASYDFFKATGSQMISGQTGANVSDLVIAARAKKRSS